MNGSRRTIPKASLSSMRSWSEPDRAANHIKHDISRVVRSIEWVGSPGGKCLFRALTGLIALKMLGIPADIALGGLIYRAGPDHVVRFCGPDGLGTVGEHCLLAHYYLISGDELVDFSVGDWKENAQWPDFFWADCSQFMPGKTLEQAWYTGVDQKLRDRDIGRQPTYCQIQNGPGAQKTPSTASFERFRK